MGHHHHHHHHGDSAGSQRALLLSILLNVGFVVIEGGFGFVTGSLALLADAGHNLSDVLGLLLAWGAVLLARKRPSGQFTYGYRKATVLAALGSALLLLIALGSMTWEAVHRFAQPPAVPGLTIIVVAAVGVVINTLSAWLLMRGSHHDLNMRGAFLHMAVDAGVSIGVVVAGALIIWTDWHWLDPAISLTIVAIVFLSTWGLLRDSFYLSIDGAPAQIDVEQVRKFLLDQPEVTEIHDFHIWALSTTETALSAHLVISDPTSHDSFLQRVSEALTEQFEIDHSTIQIERGGIHCSLGEEGQV